MEGFKFDTMISVIIEKKFLCNQFFCTWHNKQTYIFLCQCCFNVLRCEKWFHQTYSEIWVPFCMGIHNMAHKTNSGMQTLFGLNVVNYLEVMLHGFHIFFQTSSKCHELTMFINFMKTRGSKVLKNVKTNQISILSLTHHVLAKYKPLVLKIGVGYPLI